MGLLLGRGGRGQRGFAGPDKGPFVKNGQISGNSDGGQKLFEAPCRETSKSEAKMRVNFFLGPDTNLKIVDFRISTFWPIVRAPGLVMNGLN